MKHRFSFQLLFLILIIWAGGMAQAATVTPVSGSSTSIVWGNVSNVIDGVVDYNSNLALGTSLSFGPFGGPYSVRFDLGAIYDLTGFNLWNNGGSIENDGEGVNDFTLTFYDAAMSSVGSFNGNALDILASQSFSIAATGVQFVDFIINSNHSPSDPLGERAYVFFHELNFDGTPASPVPLPAALWLMASGLLGLAGVRRIKFSL